MLGVMGVWRFSRYPQRTVGGASPRDGRCATDGRLFRLTQRAETAFRIVPSHAPQLVQRKLVHLPCGMYSAATSPDPVFDDGAGLRLITHDI